MRFKSFGSSEWASFAPIGAVNIVMDMITMNAAILTLSLIHI